MQTKTKCWHENISCILCHIVWRSQEFSQELSHLNFALSTHSWECQHVTPLCHRSSHVFIACEQEMRNLFTLFFCIIWLIRNLLHSLCCRQVSTPTLKWKEVKWQISAHVWGDCSGNLSSLSLFLVSDQQRKEKMHKKIANERKSFLVSEIPIYCTFRWCLSTTLKGEEKNGVKENWTREKKVEIVSYLLYMTALRSGTVSVVSASEWKKIVFSFFWKVPKFNSWKKMSKRRKFSIESQ